ncbi:MAG: ubiquinone/menaquinone biosynthesis methyltransferase [Candidatus Omnitrophica bacterium]|nr:ubiquinone/menaquinone biosynthesis methyltransferase [Candidatus Omnitrophota bacterium]
MPTADLAAPSTATELAGKAAFVHRLFDAIAWRYDLFNRCVSLSLDRRWRRIALERAELGEGMHVLDVCTGTGDLALAAASRVQGRGASGGGMAVGLDFSAPMLRHAARKSGQSRSGALWLLGDGQRLPFGDGTFDRVTIGFSTRNFADLNAALQEMRRVLRPYGRLIVLETGKPQHPLVKLGYYAYLFGVMPFVGLVVCGLWWPFRYLARSIQRFDEPPEFLARLRGVGFDRATHLPLSWGLADCYVGVKGFA